MGRRMAHPESAQQWATRTLGASTTSLAAMRALTGAALLYESVVSIDPWTAYCFLSERGVNPRRHAALYSDQRVFSLHLAHPGAMWAAAIHAAMVVSALLLVCGWRTRAASAVGYITFTSTINRAWMLGHAFDLLLFAMLLWGALGLPWAEAWSVDAALALALDAPSGTPPGEDERRAPESREDDSSSSTSSTTTTSSGSGSATADRSPRVVLSLATAGMYAQVAALYSLSAWHKSDAAWAAGTAPLLAMDSDFISRPLARALRRSPTAAHWIMRSGPWVTRLESCAPLLLALPWEWPRALGVAALLGFHIGLALCLRLNDITLINAVGGHSFFVVLSLSRISVSSDRVLILLLFLRRASRCSYRTSRGAVSRARGRARPPRCLALPTASRRTSSTSAGQRGAARRAGGGARARGRSRGRGRGVCAAAASAPRRTSREPRRTASA